MLTERLGEAFPVLRIETETRKEGGFTSTIWMSCRKQVIDDFVAINAESARIGEPRVASHDR